MKHTLRKYISNRGSALFMVISTMTALMISCMAMYFSVVSSRSTQYAVFYQQQAYQSATSLADAIMGSISSGSGGFENLADQITALANVGDSITTGSNGFASFDVSGAGKEDEDQVGAYMIEVKRLDDETRPDGKVNKMYDLAITTSVNGTKEVYHNIFSVEETVEDVPEPEFDALKATGYAPNDVYLDGGVFTSDVFYDNEYTVLNAYGSKNMLLTGNLYCGGSLTINKYLNLVPEGKTEMLIRNNFTTYSNTTMSFQEPTGLTTVAKNKSRSNVLIGGDFSYLNFNAGAVFKNANVYVLGDLITNGNAFDSSCRYFVNGNIIIKDGTYPNLNNVYCNGVVDISQNKGCKPNGALSGKWADGATGKDNNGLMTVDEMIDYLDFHTSDAVYPKLNVKTDGLKEETIHFEPNSPTQVLRYSSSETGCIIKDITMNNDGGNNHYTLVIDTGEDPTNVYTIGLTANRAIAGDPMGEKKMFCWFPRDITDGSTTKKENMNMKYQILVMGRGRVDIKVPDGVIYQDDHEMSFRHYGWYVLNGGKEEAITGSTETDPIKRTRYLNLPNSGSDMAFYSQFIHTCCTEGDGCTYKEEPTDEDCAQECGNKKIDIVCDDHGVVDTYCKSCANALRNDHTGKCANRKDIKAIDKFLNSNPAMKSRMLDSKGKVIYPTTNIFIISNDENADIRFSTKANYDPDVPPEALSENSFYGYIYAPYITFKSENGIGNGDSGGGYVRILGGMTVSDYVIDASYGILACYPDSMPTDLADGELNSIANRNWKISLKGH